MAYHGVQTTTIPAGSTFSSAVCIRGATNIAVELQTFSVFLSAATASVYFTVCDSLAGTYRRLSAMGVYSGASGIYNIEVPNGIGNYTVHIPQLAGFNYAKVEFSVTATAAATLRIHVME